MVIEIEQVLLLEPIEVLDADELEGVVVGQRVFLALLVVLEDDVLQLLARMIGEQMGTSCHPTPPSLRCSGGCF